MEDKKMTMTTKNRNHQVDGLKGIAMILVMTYHFLLRYLELYFPEYHLPIPLLGSWGIIGVTIFFVVSGYYLIQSSEDTRLIDRIGRLWPVYAIAITVCFVLTRILPIPDRTVSIGDYMLNLLFINGFIGTPYVDGAHWYIKDLIGCYIVYAIVNKVKDDKSRTMVKTLFVVLSILLGFASNKFGSASLWYVLYSLIGSGRICMILAGETIFHLTKKDYTKAVYIEALSIALCFLNYSILYTALMIITQVLLWLVIKQFFKILAISPLCKIGEASYSIYVFHQNIGFIIIYYITQFAGKYSFMISVIVYAVMIAWGLLVYQYIEQPSRRWVKRLLKRA